jgi:hypothetical protein
MCALQIGELLLKRLPNCGLEKWPQEGMQKGQKYKVYEEGVQAAVNMARSKKSPMLLEQDRLLETHPGVDYVIVLPTGNQNCGVCLEHPLAKLTFSILREQAPKSTSAVQNMYRTLVDSNPRLESVIRKQLQAEYGVDPRD